MIRRCLVLTMSSAKRCSTECFRVLLRVREFTVILRPTCVYRQTLALRTAAFQDPGARKGKRLCREAEFALTDRPGGGAQREGRGQRFFMHNLCVICFL